MRRRKIYPTVTSVMWHPVPELRERWKRKYGKESFSFEEARELQTFPKSWIFPPQKSKRWKWLGEAFPPKVAEYLFRTYLEGSGYTLLDLFAGIGGWSLGAIWSGKFKKIVMVEIDKEKCLYLKLNFKRFNTDVEVWCGDAREFEYGYFDVVVGSPPCEDLTVLRHFCKNPTNKGTIPLTIFMLELVDRLKPKIAFYENVYRKPLVEILRRYGWRAIRFHMSKLIPQRRVRLLGVKTNKKW